MMAYFLCQSRLLKGNPRKITPNSIFAQHILIKNISALFQGGCVLFLTITAPLWQYYCIWYITPTTKRATKLCSRTVAMDAVLGSIFFLIFFSKASPNKSCPNLEINSLHKETGSKLKETLAVPGVGNFRDVHKRVHLKWTARDERWKGEVFYELGEEVKMPTTYKGTC